MELLVLRVLDWRLRCISPFCYLRFFALKIDPSGTYTEFLATRAKQIILSTIQGIHIRICIFIQVIYIQIKTEFDVRYVFVSISTETSFLECRPSCIAAATILCAANDLPKFSFITAHHAESWCDGLHKVRKIKYHNCLTKYTFMLTLDRNTTFFQDEIMSCGQLIRQNVIETKPKKQAKVFPQLRVTYRASITSTDSLSCSSSSSSTFKRRKLSNNSWTDENAGTSIKRAG